MVVSADILPTASGETLSQTSQPSQSRIPDSKTV